MKVISFSAMTKHKSNQIEFLQQALEQQTKLNQQLSNELTQQRILIENLQAQIENLLRTLYGKKSERKLKKSAPDEGDTSNESSKKQSSNSTSTGTAKRKKLPESLPRETIRHELSEKERACDHCGTICQMIGKEVSEQLEFIPARLYVKEHRCYKYGCKFGCQVKIAPMPPQPIEKGIPGPGLLADVLISKYQDAMPLYRQSLRFKRHGVELADSTLCDWVAQCANLFAPIVEAMKADLLRNQKLHTDDTVVPVLAKGKTKQSRLWVYVADGSDGPACTVYDYSATRSQKVPQKFLGDFQGYLQADAYVGYDILYKTGDVVEVGCLAHARRKFHEIAKTVKDDSLAHEAIDLIAEIYKIEKSCRNWPYKERYYYRKQYLKPVYRRFLRWLTIKKRRVIPNTPIEKAINYSLNHWRALQNVFADGRLEVDNNKAERAIKPVVIGRKNYLFAGSHEGGKRAAIIYSLIESAKQNQINSFDYLKDILTKIPTQLASKVHELLPYNWKP